MSRIVLEAEQMLLGRFAKLAKLQARIESKGTRTLKSKTGDVPCELFHIAPLPEGSENWTEDLCIDPATSLVRESIFQERRSSPTGPATYEIRRRYDDIKSGGQIVADLFTFTPPRGAKR